MLQAFTPSTGQTTHRQKPGPATPNVFTSTVTNTRAQTHQNLFTLTKNNLLLNNQAGSKHPTLPRDRPLQEPPFERIETRFSL
jgi:hypothetical protein